MAPPVSPPITKETVKANAEVLQLAGKGGGLGPDHVQDTHSSHLLR